MARLEGELVSGSNLGEMVMKIDMTSDSCIYVKIFCKINCLKEFTVCSQTDANNWQSEAIPAEFIP